MNESSEARTHTSSLNNTHILTEECIRLKFRDANFCLSLETFQKLAASSHSIKLIDSPSVQFSYLFRNVLMLSILVVASRFIGFVNFLVLYL